MTIPSINPELEALGLSRDLRPRESAGQELGAEAFLKLMITQFRNQDPFKPLESGEFLGQLAQFGTVSGLTELKKEFQGLAGSLVSNQALQASSLLGRDVLVARQAGYLAAGESVRGAVDLPSAAQQVRVQVVTPGGAVVRTLELGPQGAGLARFSWDGVADDGSVLPEGAYTFRAQAINGTSQSAVQSLVAAPVESVTMGGGQTGLSLTLRGLGEVPFRDVRQIG
ncbi:MAG: flagellar hook assembly protein FlgD [Steroidobacteraceae bacterium]|jgi:flagellar basal-body rod modification protein FlgD|nr:flagellar hook assembly protein FlgD [Steroidobacteraceae bacterium]